MMEQKKLVRRNPADMWTENKEITIRLEAAGEQLFICLYDHNKEEYFYSPEADYAYHKRLFNKQMDVVITKQIYTTEEMRNIAMSKFLKANKQRNKALDVLQQTIPELKESKHRQIGEQQ